MVERHGDFSGIRTRLQLGIPLTDEEQAALAALDRGDKLRTGPKDPATESAESVVCWRWLVERCGWTPANARSLIAEMTGTESATIKERLARVMRTKPAKGQKSISPAVALARNIADLSFQIHAQRDVTPALLRHRTPAGQCAACRRFQCRCDPAPRPAFEDADEGATVAALLSFWRGPQKPSITTTASPPSDAGKDDPDGWEAWHRDA